MEFSDRSENQKASITRIHADAERANAENDPQEHRNYRKYTRKLLNNTYARNRTTYRQNRRNLEASIRRKTERSEGEISAAEHALLTRQSDTERELRQRMIEIDNARQRQLDADAQVYCQNKSANSMEEWVAARVLEFELLLNGNIRPSEFNGGHPPYPPELADWTIIYASGNSNNCLVHSLLTLTSPTFRQLSDDNKNRLAQAFRIGPFLEIPNLNEDQRERLQSRAFLDDTDLIRLEHCYKLNILLITQLHDEGQRIEQVLGNLDYLDQPVYFILNEGNAHYEPLQNPDGTFIMNYAQAVALRDRYAPGAERPPSLPQLPLGSDSTQTLKGQIEASDKTIQDIQTQIQNKENELHEVKQYDIHDNEELILGEMKAIYKKLKESFNNKLKIENNSVVDNKGVVKGSLQDFDIFFIGRNVPTLYGILYTNFKKYLSDYGTGLQKQTNILNEIEGLKGQKVQEEANKRILQTKLVSLTGSVIERPTFGFSSEEVEQRRQKALEAARIASELAIRQAEDLGITLKSELRSKAIQAATEAAKLHAVSPLEAKNFTLQAGKEIGAKVAKNLKLKESVSTKLAGTFAREAKKDLISDLPLLREPLISRTFIDFLKEYELKNKINTNVSWTKKINSDNVIRKTKEADMQEKYRDYEIKKPQGLLRPEEWQKELWDPETGDQIPGSYPEKVLYLDKQCDKFKKSQQEPVNSLLGVDYGLTADTPTIYDFISNVFLNPIISTDELVSFKLTPERKIGSDAYETLAMLFILFGGIPQIQPRAGLPGYNYTFCDKLEVTTPTGFVFYPKIGNFFKGNFRATQVNGVSDVTLFSNAILDPTERERYNKQELPNKNKKIYKTSVKYWAVEGSPESYDIQKLYMQHPTFVQPEHMGILVFVKNREAFVEKCKEIKSDRYISMVVCEPIYGWEQNVKPFINDVRNALFVASERLQVTPIELFNDIFDIS